MSTKEFHLLSGNKNLSYPFGGNHIGLAIALTVALLFLGGSLAGASNPVHLLGTPTNAWSIHAPVCPPGIDHGETIQCSISSPAEMDTYTFTASAGDSVLVKMSKSSGTMWPEVRVYDTGGVKVCEAYSATSAEIGSCTLASGGTYSILAHDYFGTDTGDYYLYLQRLNNPGNALPIEWGTVIDGAIVSPAQTDTYSFAVTASDNVRVRMRAVSGSLWPGLRVYGPDGAMLCEGGAPDTAEVTDCTLPEAGAYSILAFDSFDGTLTGEYRLGLNCCTIHLPLVRKSN